MKNINDCIAENKEFLPSLKKSVSEAIAAGEADDADIFIFIDSSCNLDKIVTGYCLKYWGKSENFVESFGYKLNHILELEDHEPQI